MLLRLPGQGNRQLTAISVTSTDYRKLHFEFESRYYFLRRSQSRWIFLYDNSFKFRDGSLCLTLNFRTPEPRNGNEFISLVEFVKNRGDLPLENHSTRRTLEFFGLIQESVSVNFLTKGSPFRYRDPES